ncbi:Iron-sulfur assembly protein 1 [Pleurotus pulmonarius]|nr:Iron-sulfur assembly protein 1 [Pleurotus pulmonarius]
MAASATRLSRLGNAARISHPLYFSFNPVTPGLCTRRALMSALRSGSDRLDPSLANSPPLVVPSATSLSSNSSSPQTAAPPPPVPKAERPRPKLRSTKAALDIVSNVHLTHRPHLSDIPRVRNKGCAGLSYHLEYVDKPGKFDEIVEQDGVRVLIDSKALFSIIGSEMDWKEDALSAKFAFRNPNIKDACGCGESFSVSS